MTLVSSYTKINLNVSKINTRPDTIKLLEENIREKHFSLANDFLGIIPIQGKRNNKVKRQSMK